MKNYIFRCSEQHIHKGFFHKLERWSVVYLLFKNYYSQMQITHSMPEVNIEHKVKKKWTNEKKKNEKKNKERIVFFFVD